MRPKPLANKEDRPLVVAGATVEYAIEHLFETIALQGYPLEIAAYKCRQQYS
ncbi:hypothetical protein [Methylotuvimicrobium alcaliphilum]|uniref:hypothetical protein n=1 Tax=Methylotuvimicrobium alcaliphilum TaxID=271065 RepID=UPI00031FA4EA|nr:hypothetical protein [Methylotuvimicrobium alcaliphilum]